MFRRRKTAARGNGAQNRDEELGWWEDPPEEGGLPDREPTDPERGDFRFPDREHDDAWPEPGGREGLPEHGPLPGRADREDAARADLPGEPRKPAVVATLLSKKPRKGAAAAVGWTLAILAAVSAVYWWGPPAWARALPASGETVFGRGETWRLLTAMAAHADAIHLLSNSAFLAWLIYLSYGAFGRSLYPFCAVPAGALSLAVTLEGYPPHLRVVGASGLLYLLAGSWLTLYVLVERRLSIWQRLLRVTGFFLVVLVPTSIRPEVSYRAHGIGFFFGICLGLAYFLARQDTIRSSERLELDRDESGAA